MTPAGFVAVLAGWITTEVGRQPWTVYGLMRTSDSVSPSLTGSDVALSLALYVIVYLIMYPTGIAFMAGLVRRGPEDAPKPAAIESGHPVLPFGAVPGRPASDAQREE
jgi:cytochrome d ubiquinol oxidase subunit I